MKNFIFYFIVLLVIGFTVILFPDLFIYPGELTEGHQSIKRNCLSCHTAFAGPTVEKCTGCHNIQFIGSKNAAGKNFNDDKVRVIFHNRLKSKNCFECHSDHNGFDSRGAVINFSHDFLEAELENECAGCHLKQKPDNEIHNNVLNECSNCHINKNWKEVSFNHLFILAEKKNACINCHFSQKPADEIHRLAAGNCSECHTTGEWKDVKFNHNSLLPEFKNECSTCHSNIRPVDELHSVQQLNCAVCHATKAWKPSTFNHKKYFIFDRNHPADCNTCHTTNTDYKKYTCYSCHEHSPRNIEREHLKEGIRNFTDCVKCHRSGDEDEAKNRYRNMPED